MKHPLSIEQHIKLAASAWRPGVSLKHIIGFAWGAGFDYEQTLLECSAAGYSMCVAGPRIKADWARMDAEYLAYQLTQEEGYVPTNF